MKDQNTPAPAPTGFGWVLPVGTMLVSVGGAILSQLNRRAVEKAAQETEENRKSALMALDGVRADAVGVGRRFEEYLQRMQVLVEAVEAAEPPPAPAPEAPKKAPTPKEGAKRAKEEKGNARSGGEVLEGE